MGGLSKVLLAFTSLVYLFHPVIFCWAVYSTSGIRLCYILGIERLSGVQEAFSLNSFLPQL